MFRLVPLQFSYFAFSSAVSQRLAADSLSSCFSTQVHNMFSKEHTLLLLQLASFMQLSLQHNYLCHWLRSGTSWHFSSGTGAQGPYIHCESALQKGCSLAVGYVLHFTSACNAVSFCTCVHVDLLCGTFPMPPSPTRPDPTSSSDSANSGKL